MSEESNYKLSVLCFFFAVLHFATFVWELFIFKTRKNVFMCFWDTLLFLWKKHQAGRDFLNFLANTSTVCNRSSSDFGKIRFCSFVVFYCILLGNLFGGISKGASQSSLKFQRSWIRSNMLKTHKTSLPHHQ